MNQTTNNLTQCTLLIFFLYILMHHIPNIWTVGMFYKEFLHFYVRKSIYLPTGKYLQSYKMISPNMNNVIYY